ncbi:unnamed protein product [Discosporangium mesarthrocarpum]
MELLSQGAEARVFATTFCGRPAVIKERFRKSYRHPALDEKLTTRRTLQEVRCMVKARRVGVETPTIYMVDSANTSIVMERVDGITVKQFLRENMEGRPTRDPAASLRVAGDIGRAVAKMHDAQASDAFQRGRAGVVHGDLTTSNFLIRNKAPRKLVAIDFGLAFSQPLPEDKAVDLYVLERAFVSTHAGSEPLVEEALRSYEASSDKILAKATMRKLADVRKRGRKREMFG